MMTKYQIHFKGESGMLLLLRYLVPRTGFVLLLALAGFAAPSSGQAWTSYTGACPDGDTGVNPSAQCESSAYNTSVGDTLTVWVSAGASDCSRWPCEANAVTGLHNESVLIGSSWVLMEDIFFCGIFQNQYNSSGSYSSSPAIGDCGAFMHAEGGN